MCVIYVLLYRNEKEIGRAAPQPLPDDEDELFE